MRYVHWDHPTKAPLVLVVRGYFGRRMNGHQRLSRYTLACGHVTYRWGSYTLLRCEECNRLRKRARVLRRACVGFYALGLA